jgi:hypothetical protein
MINIKALKESAPEFQEPMRSVIQMSKNEMSDQDFIDFFIGLRKKARQMDSKKEAMKND